MSHRRIIDVHSASKVVMMSREGLKRRGEVEGWSNEGWRGGVEEEGWSNEGWRCGVVEEEEYSNEVHMDSRITRG